MKIISCEPLNRGFGAKRGTAMVPGYECTLRIDDEELRLILSASKSLLSSRGVANDDERYRALCREVAKRTTDTSMMLQIKKEWKDNDASCFALAKQGTSSKPEEVVVTYGPTWKEPTGWGSPRVLWIPLSAEGTEKERQSRDRSRSNK